MKLKCTASSLKRMASTVTQDSSKYCQEFSKFLLNKTCVALSAPQVGDSIRIVGVKTRNRKSCTIMVNPVVTKVSKKTVIKPERCLLGNGLVLTADVERPKWVVVTYSTPDLSKDKRKVFRGRLAAAACHVIDITNGKPIK